MKAHHIEELANMKDDTRIALLEQTIGHINDTLIRFEKRFDRLEEKIDSGFDKIDKRFDKVDQRFERIESQMWKNMFWTIAALAGILTLIAQGFKWI